MTNLNSDQVTIASLVEDYRTGFLSLDPEGLASIWDKGAEGLIYVAQEKAAPLFG